MKAGRVAVGFVVAAALGCASPGPTASTTSTSTSTSTPTPTSISTPPSAAIALEGAEPPGDARRGEALVARFECARCHDGTGQPAPVFDRQCKGCHQRVEAGTLPFPRARLEGWRANLRHYVTTPDLAQAGSTLKPSWIAAFLREPTKVRPHMEEWMPRLRLSGTDAADIAAFLTSAAEPAAPVPDGGDVERGKELAGEHGCFACHEFTGAARAQGAATIPDFPQPKLGAAIVRAPDLRTTRDRFRPDLLARWIKDPSSIKRGALMPAVGVTEEEARDLAAYVLHADLAPLPLPATPFVRLPLLDRRVTYDEVASRVFKKSCVHCHGEPDGKGGDPGPGSAGGLGFAPRGVRLSSYAGVELGYLADGRTRRSLLLPEADLDRLGGARLVAALVARHEEVAGRPNALVRGMPLGLPPLAAEDIQLLESWVAEGAPLR